MGVWVYSKDTEGTGAVVGQGVTTYFPIAGGGAEQATEARVQARFRGGYTASNLWCNVTSISGTCTLTDRKNGAAGGQSISITTTGTKEDTTNTTALADGDLYNLQAVTSGSHSNTCTFHVPSVLLDDSGSNIPILIAYFSGVSFELGASFSSLVGAVGDTDAESNAQITVRAAATLSALRFYIVTNSFADTTTWRTRVNGANGGQSVSVASASTGDKEDTTGSDTIAVGDEICFGKDAGGTSGSATLYVVQVKSASAVAWPLASRPVGTAFAASLIRYLPLWGRVFDGHTTESTAQIKARVVDTFKNLQTNVIANSRSDATTFDLRAGAASPGGGPSVSVAAGITGIQEDLVGSYVSAATDLINYRIVTGGGTGTITATTLGVQQGVGAAAAVSLPPFQRRTRYVTRRF